MGHPTQSRRERLRETTAAEIKTIALKHMAANGTASISLRAIARDMGMTAGAIYSYFDTRDALISALIADVYTSLADTLEAARDSRPAEDPAGRVMAYGRAYRHWAVTNPEEFRLVYGDSVPDYQPPEGGAAAEAEHRACALLTGIVADAWPRAQHLHVSGTHSWTDYDPDFGALVRDSFPGLPPAAVALSLRVWGRMHGLVSLEVYGHLRPQVLAPEKLYLLEMFDLTKSLGLTCPEETRDDRA
ncbi:TetR/AcrR family transcriptional regulator [Kitasatospora sp. NPDC057015]|uniref:TetR/AcrR family transcriptional regulator n=1 Tax=Kitasatospora sp. NPDC057015 TaxID=3346001 RepID=UPI00363C9EB4